MLSIDDLPEKITKINDLQFKDVILKTDKNFNIFFQKYLFLFVKASKLWHSNFNNFDDLQEEIRTRVMLSVNDWKGSSSLGTYVFSCLKFNSLNPITQNWTNTLDRKTNSQEFDYSNLQSNVDHKFYERIHKLNLDEDETTVFDYLNRTVINDNEKIHSLRSFNNYIFKRKINKSVNYEKVKRRLAYKIITEFLPERKDLLLKFDLVKLRP